jgi:hypothetical protein
MARSLTWTFSNTAIQNQPTVLQSEVITLSSLSSSELKAERDRLLLSDKCSEKDLDRIVAIDEILEQRGDDKMNFSKLKNWHCVALGTAIGFLGVQMFLNKPQTYQMVQPQITPNTVSVPSGTGTTVLNFDND